MRDRRAVSLLSAEGATLVILLVAAVIFFSVLKPVYLSADNIENILVQSMFVLLIAAGMTFVLITGAIDLSVGSVLGLCAGVSVYVLVSGGSTIAAIVVALAVGLLIGTANGVLVAKAKLNDFIVTLATLGIAGGALQLLAADKPLNGFDAAAFTALANNKVIGIPVPVIIGAAIVIALEFVLRRTGFGRAVFAVGINPRAARLSGVPVDRVRIAVFAISGLLAAVAGILLASRLSSVPARLGQGYELQAIAAAVLGGTSLAGGRGSVALSALGALFLGAVSVGLQVLEIDSSWFTVITGVSIVVAMAADKAMRTVVLSRLGIGRGTDDPLVGMPAAKEMS